MELLKNIVKAIKEVEDEYNYKIKQLQNKIAGYEKERELIIKNLKNNNIETLKHYFNIHGKEL